MPQPFEQDDELDVETTLIAGFDFADDPKPSLTNVIKLIKEGEIAGRRTDEGVWMIPSISQFVSELDEWKRRTGWSSISVWNALPAGYVGVGQFCRDNVPQTIGYAQRLFQKQGTKSQPQLSQHARVLIAAGDVMGALQVHHGIWAAKPTDVKQWLYRRFAISTR